MKDQRKPATICVHSMRSPRLAVTPVTTPIYQASTFVFESVRQLVEHQERRARGVSDDGLYLYSRYANPTNDEVQALIAELEGMEDCLLFSSGMAAISAVLLSRLKSGDRVIATDCLYGGVHHLLTGAFPRFGIEVAFVPTTDPGAWGEAVGANARVFYTETPTNPNLQIVDLREVARFCREHGLFSIVDNTFATPVNQRPADFGIDCVVHSGSKYLGGHSDLICGAVASSGPAVEQILANLKLLGSSLDPFAAFLLARGLKTLPLRVERQNENAARIAHFLSEHPKVKAVHYPGLKSHPGHGVASRQMKGFGGMVCFELQATREQTERMVDSLRVFVLAASLGGVESLVSMPVHTSHWGYSDEELRRSGVTGTMARLSLGIEDAGDLIEDLAQALDRI